MGYDKYVDRKKSDELLSVRGFTPVNVPSATSSSPASTDDDPDVTGDDLLSERPKLTEAEIFKILLRWEADGLEQPHEPMEGQLTMEQAIDIGKADLSNFLCTRHYSRRTA